MTTPVLSQPVNVSTTSREYSPTLVDWVVIQTNAIWSRVLGIPRQLAVHTWYTLRSRIGKIVREGFFFPLANPTAHLQELLKVEENYNARFWDRNTAVDLNFREHKKIREGFTVSDRNILIKSIGEKKILMLIRLFESSRPEHGDYFYNFVFIPGNLSKINSDILSIYPFLVSYVEKDPTISGRFIFITEYDMQCIEENGEKKPYYPDTLEEAGVILANTLVELDEKYGKIHQLVAHSLGSILFAASLKCISSDLIDRLPKHICLDRGPSSIAEASKKVWFGSLFFCLATIAGWTLEIDKEVMEFCQKYKKIKRDRGSFIVIGVKQDRYFSGDANLCFSEKISSLQKDGLLQVLIFDPPQQVIPCIAHHSAGLHFFHRGYLIDPSNQEVMKEEEHVADLLIRQSLS